jgi:hypothetical protein
VGSLEKVGAAMVAALWRNPGEGLGVPVLEHPLDGVMVLRGGVLRRPELGAEEKGGGTVVMGAL